MQLGSNSSSIILSSTKLLISFNCFAQLGSNCRHQARASGEFSNVTCCSSAFRIYSACLFLCLCQQCAAEALRFWVVQPAGCPSVHCPLSVNTYFTWCNIFSLGGRISMKPQTFITWVGITEKGFHDQRSKVKGQGHHQTNNLTGLMAEENILMVWHGGSLVFLVLFSP